MGLGCGGCGGGDMFVEWAWGGGEGNDYRAVVHNSNHIRAKKKFKTIFAGQF